MQQGEEREDPTECGIFVSDIARGTTDEQLKERFSAIGPVFDALVVKNKFSGETKGYGFVRFFTKAHVYKALEWTDPPVFQDCVSGKMQTVKITIADPKNCLYVGNIPRNLKESEVAQRIQDLSQFPLRKFKLSVCTDGTSKGFGWATFVDHKSALEALKNLQHNPLDGNFLQVSLAEPKAVDSRALDNVKVLFVKGLGSAVTRESLKAFFGDSVEKVVIPLDTVLGTPLGHAFVHFNTREQAEAALDRFQGQVLDGRTLTIEWCLPHGFRGNKQTKTGKSDSGWPPMVPAHMPPFYPPWQHPYQGYLPAYDMHGGGGRGRGYGRGRGGRGRGVEHYYPEYSYSAPYPSYLPYDPYSFGNYMPLPVSSLPTQPETTVDSPYLPPNQYMTAPSPYKATTQRESPRYTPY